MTEVYEIEIKQEPLLEYEHNEADVSAIGEPRIKREKHCERDTALRNLYDEHEIKDEMVIGPVQLQSGAAHDAVVVVCAHHDATCALHNEMKQSCDMSHSNSHTGSHQSPESLTCNICGKSFRWEAVLLRHIDTHNKIKKKHSCDVCNKTFQSNSKLQAHSRTHTGEKPYSCVVCGNSFAMKYTLQMHMKCVHTNPNRNYSCEVCNKGFYNKTKLQIHTRTHTGEKPYSCDVCSKRFSSKYSLRVHIKYLHTNKNRKYFCSLCNKGFYSKYGLQVHSSTHTSEKPYSCDVCGKNFSRKQNLQTHIKYSSQQNLST